MDLLVPTLGVAISRTVIRLEDVLPLTRSPRQDASAFRRFDTESGFVVATGIECSAPVVAGGIRQDELLKTGHWDRYAEDFGLVEDLGIAALRVGVPFHVVAREPGRHDWTWTDAMLAELRRRDVEPIVDLLHFGLPDDLAGMSDPRLPERFLAYLTEFVDRNPWVRCYTPVNEPFISACYSARTGWWNEQTTDDATFVRAIDNLVTCAVRGMEIIRERRPDAVFLQSDVCWSFDASGPETAERAAFLNDLRFVTFDLTYGRRPSPRIVAWLAENGLGEDRLRWFEEHGSSAGCVVGHDYYRGNEYVVLADGSEEVLTERRGYAALAREYHEHLGLPFMLAETNISTELAPDWLAEVWNDAVVLRDEGLPIRGFCWYSLTDQVDWNTTLRFDHGHVDTFGLVDLDRRIRPVGEVYGRLAHAAARGSVERVPDGTGAAPSRDAGLPGASVIAA